MLFMGMDITMVRKVYRNMAPIIIKVRNTSESRGRMGPQDTSMMGIYSSDTMKMVRTAKPRGSLRGPDTGMSW